MGSEKSNTRSIFQLFSGILVLSTLDRSFALEVPKAESQSWILRSLRPVGGMMFCPQPEVRSSPERMVVLTSELLERYDLDSTPMIPTTVPPKVLAAIGGMPFATITPLNVEGE